MFWNILTLSLKSSLDLDILLRDETRSSAVIECEEEVISSNLSFSRYSLLFNDSLRVSATWVPPLLFCLPVLLWMSWCRHMSHLDLGGTYLIFITTNIILPAQDPSCTYIYIVCIVWTPPTSEMALVVPTLSALRPQNHRCHCLRFTNPVQTHRFPARALPHIQINQLLRQCLLTKTLIPTLLSCCIRSIRCLK